MLTPNLVHVPDILQEGLQCQWESLVDALGDESRAQFTECLRQLPDLNQQLVKCLAGSDFALRWCQRNNADFIALLESGDLHRTYPYNHYQSMLEALLADASDEDALGEQLRIIRHREMVRLIFRDFNRLAPMRETTRDISDLAQAAVKVSLGYLHNALCTEIGTPRSAASGEEQKLVVIAMGKMGAFELNLSSDIDLIFAYPEAGETAGAARSVENQQFFMRLGQRLIKVLDQVTGQGFVFRVDMRLRPYGKSGALAVSFDAMEDYYQSQGRDWERYAMIKARVIAGDPEAGQQLMDSLRPFTYRRYLDFSAINSLREMKAMIDRQNQMRGRELDIKLGPGGIREVEFIAQSFQLIHAGRDLELQERSVQRVLDLLVSRDCLSELAAAQLQRAYEFLRNTEHALQGYADKQTQLLPTDDTGRARLAFVMGFSDWSTFEAELAQHRKAVSEHFSDVVSEPEQAAQEDSGASSLASQQEWLSLWQDELSDEQATTILSMAGYEDSQSSWHLLHSLRSSRMRAVMQVEGRDRLDRFMPVLLEALSHSKEPSATLARVLPLIEAVSRRTAYLVLLMENHHALQQLVLLFEASPWIAVQLTRQPVLLDELLNTNMLYTIPDRETLREELAAQLSHVPPEDMEGNMDSLRYFKLAHQLRVAANEISGKLPLMKVSDYLTQIAEVLIEQVVQLAWQQLVLKHGAPAGVQCTVTEPNFVVVAYGKMGGIELSHSSDLDLVFIHNAPISKDTDGERPISNEVFYARLGQRIIHLVDARTTLGQLYEIDMRLRPSGDSGLLVASLKGFEDYQNSDAWTWEHQALVRARVIAGDPRLAEPFQALRKKILCQQRDVENLQHDVVQMRKKMRDHLLPKPGKDEEKQVFSLKHGMGGIVDIEFMVQYLVLAWAYKFPTLVEYTDNIRILNALGEVKLLSQRDAQALADAYKTYRATAHELGLLELPAAVEEGELGDHRAAVIRLWQSLFGDAGGDESAGAEAG